MTRSGADVLSIAAGVIIGGSVLAFAGRGLESLPLLDGWVSAVIRVDDVTDIRRMKSSPTSSTGRACFTLHLTKLGNATPVKYEMHAETRYSPKIGISIFLVNADDTRKAEQRLATHDAGTSWERRYCFDVPGTISDADEMTITGDAFHQRSPLWETQTRLPAFTIGPA